MQRTKVIHVNLMINERDITCVEVGHCALKKAQRTKPPDKGEKLVSTEVRSHRTDYQ